MIQNGEIKIKEKECKALGEQTRVNKITFLEYMIDKFAHLQIQLHFPRASKEKYEQGIEGTYERLKDEIRCEQLKEIIRNNPEWDIEEFGKEASKRIQKRARVY